MTTYYDDGLVQVTSTAVRVDGHSYPLAECVRIWHQRSTRSWRTVTRRVALGLAIGSPVVAAALGLLTALHLHASPTVTIAVVGASVLTGLAIGPLADLLLEHLDRSYARGSRQWEIWVQWHGGPVRLVHTTDAIRFGQIYRAIQRATEHQSPAPR